MRRLIAALAAVAMLAGASAAQARAVVQLVAETAVLSAPPEEVWAVIGHFQDMSWHPGIFSSTGEKGDDVGATRVLTLGAANGPTIREELYQYSASRMHYAYRITEVDLSVLPVTHYTAHLTIWPGQNGGSLVEWRGEFYRGDPHDNPEPELSDSAATAAVKAVYRAGLDALKARFEPGK